MGWLSALEGRGSPLADRDPVIIERRGTGMVDPARDCDAHEQDCACRERLVLEETDLARCTKADSAEREALRRAPEAAQMSSLGVPAPNPAGEFGPITLLPGSRRRMVGHAGRPGTTSPPRGPAPFSGRASERSPKP
jgi:hypothetical protein